MAAKSNTTADFTEFVRSLRDLCDQFLGDDTKAPKSKKADADDEDDATEAPGPKWSEAALKTMPLAKLRELAIAEGYEEDEVSEAKKPELIEALLDDDESEEPEDEDAEDDESEDEDEGDEEDEDEEGEVDEDEELEAEREELMGLSLAKLRKTARDDYNATPAELKGLDKEGIVDLILGAEEEDDSDVGIDEESDEDEDGYTEDELDGMELAELREVLDEWEVDYSPKARKATLIKLILEAQDEEEYEDE
ncbi:hypothetical protein BH789_gp072 [Gordonia phage GMA6]|uniref:Rho termination factor-like N-terminal domain-containing protein n=1 Tax=Gordonia phage GMA6 TaxID=1647285 RepID=A0A0K0NL92_9CAUD|nr:hypothetical protein BH789_gp072 [Gordonia phage GMA6]AKL88353.1 hypothetical protein GMA6_72 [Gordonia phage GMA6]